MIGSRCDAVIKKKTLTMMANNIGRGQCYCDCLNPKLGVCGARNKKGHSMI